MTYLCIPHLLFYYYYILIIYLLYPTLPFIDMRYQMPPLLLLIFSPINNILLYYFNLITIYAYKYE